MISLVPYGYHSTVIKIAIKHKVNVVTTSYVSPAIKELESASKEAGIVVLNEVGFVHSKGPQRNTFLLGVRIWVTRHVAGVRE